MLQVGSKIGKRAMAQNKEWINATLAAMFTDYGKVPSDFDPCTLKGSAAQFEALAATVLTWSDACKKEGGKKKKKQAGDPAAAAPQMLPKKRSATGNEDAPAAAAKKARVQGSQFTVGQKIEALYDVTMPNGGSTAEWFSGAVAKVTPKTVKVSFPDGAINTFNSTVWGARLRA